jgi:4-hydroxy-tetrahydrodipicolinate synthase
LKFRGSICAIVTPFLPSGELDLPAFGRLLDGHLAAGTDAIVVAGSTGESVALEVEEFETLLGAAVTHLRGRVRVIAGCGAASTAKALRLMHCASDMGAEGALVVTPYYVRPTQEGLFRHYAALADEGRLPVVLYNVPTRTGVDLLPETVTRLATRDRIAGIKEARGEPERMQALLPLRSDSFAVLSGDDPTAARAMLAGADGVISVAGNVVPRAFRRLCTAVMSGSATEAQALDARMARLYRFLGAEPNPVPVKWLLQRSGAIAGALRLPLLELSAALHEEGDACLGLVGELESGNLPNAALVA